MDLWILEKAYELVRNIYRNAKNKLIQKLERENCELRVQLTCKDIELDMLKSQIWRLRQRLECKTEVTKEDEIRITRRNQQLQAIKDIYYNGRGDNIGNTNFQHRVNEHWEN